MKNKHLVLLFLLTLLIGLAIRRAPWRDATTFRARLLPLDTASVQRIDVGSGAQGLTLVRNDAGWSAEQKNRSANVPPNQINAILAALADMHSVRIAKSAAADSVGVNSPMAIQVVIYSANAPAEHLVIGNETIENGQAATFVRLPGHEGVYLIEHHLRAIFTKKLADFRNPDLIKFKPEEVAHFFIHGPGIDSVNCRKTDSPGLWQSTLNQRFVPNDSIQLWLAQFERLKKLPYADLFDETHASKTLYAQIDMGIVGREEPLGLKIYRLKSPVLPEELPDDLLDKGLFATFVLYCSQNPTNYFALPDTTLLRRLCQPF